MKRLRIVGGVGIDVGVGGNIEKGVALQRVGTEIGAGWCGCCGWPGRRSTALADAIQPDAEHVREEQAHDELEDGEHKLNQCPEILSRARRLVADLQHDR